MTSKPECSKCPTISGNFSYSINNKNLITIHLSQFKLSKFDNLYSFCFGFIHLCDACEAIQKISSSLFYVIYKIEHVLACLRIPCTNKQQIRYKINHFLRSLCWMSDKFINPFPCNLEKIFFHYVIYYLWLMSSYMHTFPL